MDKAVLAILLAILGIILSLAFSADDLQQVNNIIYINDQNLTFTALNGTGVAYVCVYENGTLYRNNETACI